MLGWVLKRGLEGGRDAMDGPDDTQIDQPDTPGPVFAARAFKSALFGTPAPPDSDTNDDKPRAASHTEVTPAVRRETATSGSKADAKDTTPPRRLAGILLTPGTGTTRRKRVSFGHDVEENKSSDNQQNNEKPQKKEFRVDRSNRRNSLFGEPARAGSTAASDGDRSRTRSKLSEAIENARKANSRPSKAEAVDVPRSAAQKQEQKSAQGPEKQPQQPQETAADHAGEDGVWEEVEEEDDEDGEWDPDVTVDLNEPHSQSGRFWKAQFQRYQEDAKVEMSRLLKYKQLAKSYAKMKDAEAMDMRAKLQEEKHKVVQMEDRITELAGQIARKRMKGSNRDYQELISDLTRQTALAVQYRNQVKELEAMLQVQVDDDDGDGGGGGDRRDVGADDDSVLTARSRRLLRQTAAGGGAAGTAVSPRTQHTLRETQRELRRAREQVRELTQARDEARRLRTALRAAETRAQQSEREAKGLRAELAAAQAAAQVATERAEDQARRAQFAEEERRRTDDALRRLQRKYDTLKDDAKARVGEAEQVLRRKNEEISQWKKMATSVHKGGAEAEAEAPVPGTKTGISDDARPGKAASTPGLAALEKLTRTRYEALRRHRQQSHGAAGRTADDDADADDDFAIRLGNVRFEPDDEPAAAAAAATQEPELPQQKKRVLPAKQKEAPGTFQILEDVDDETYIDGPLAPRLPQHSHRPRAAEALRTIPGPQRPRTSTTATKTTTTDAMDVSRCSLASERAAAAVARIEKRRAERKQKLDQLRNKENMQPA